MLYHWFPLYLKTPLSDNLPRIGYTTFQLEKNEAKNPPSSNTVALGGTILGEMLHRYLVKINHLVLIDQLGHEY